MARPSRRRPPRRQPTAFWARTRACFADYAEDASVHGVKYVAEGTRHVAERFFWAIVLLLSLGLCVQQIYNMWLKWTYAPVIVSFDEKSTPVWEIPFPAVTICSETKARQTLFNFTLAMGLFDSGEINATQLDKLSDLSLLCEQKQFVKGKAFTTNDVIELFREMSPSMDAIIQEVSWCKMQKHISEIFTPIIIGEGMCFSFNMLDPREMFTNITEQYHHNFTFHDRKTDNWRADSGYGPNAPVDTYPRRAVGSGYSSSLVVLLRSYTIDIDYLCKGPVPGFRVLLHNPAELPWVSQDFLRSDLNQELVVSVRPYMMTTNKGLQQYSPYVRQCFFPSERQLKYFKLYTQNNCQQECLADFTLAYCGCVGFYMPRTAKMKICGSGKRSCMSNAAGEMVKREVEKDLAGSRMYESLKCDCLPSCTDMQYNGETSTAKFSWKEMFTAKRINLSGDEWEDANVGRVVVFFKDSYFIKYTKNKIFGATEFWANCGGLLGLFLGMSVLSILEMIYHLVFRFCLDSLKNRRPFIK